eukprot:3068581-Rhodomonas_salina.1
MQCTVSTHGATLRRVYKHFVVLTYGVAGDLRVRCEVLMQGQLTRSAVLTGDMVPGVPSVLANFSHVEPSRCVRQAKRGTDVACGMF